MASGLGFTNVWVALSLFVALSVCLFVCLLHLFVSSVMTSEALFKLMRQFPSASWHSFLRFHSFQHHSKHNIPSELLQLHQCNSGQCTQPTKLVHQTNTKCSWSSKTNVMIYVCRCLEIKAICKNLNALMVLNNVDLTEYTQWIICLKTVRLNLLTIKCPLPREPAGIFLSCLSVACVCSFAFVS